MSIFVIIPVHNRLELTRACLASLREQSHQDFHVVVVDDGSTDGTGETLAEEFPAVTILKGDGTLWWTAATNLGVGWALARAQPHDAVLTLNNDTIAPAGFLERLLRARALEPCALVGSLLVSATDRETIVDGGVTVDWVTAKYRTAGRGDSIEVGAEVPPSLRRVDVLSGCGTMIPTCVFERIGRYDEVRLRHYAADYEFARRALRAGFGLFVDWASVLFSWEAATGIHASVANAGFSGLMRSFLDIRSANDFRNRWQFAVAACPGWALPTYVPCDYARVVIGSIRRYRSHEPAPHGPTALSPSHEVGAAPSDNNSGGRH